MNRGKRANLAQETLQILEKGFYTINGRNIDISAAMAAAKGSLTYYSPDNAPNVPQAPKGKHATTIEITDETTLEAAARLTATHPEQSVMVLNFASAKNPGGGFLGGSQAQEESLARSTGLYPCIVGHEIYEVGKACGTCLYTHAMTHCRDVPVIRNDSGALIEPFTVSVVSSAAVNRGALEAKNNTGELAQAQAVMDERARIMLNVCAAQGHDVLVLGAWGAGVFKNSSADIAKMFADLLLGDFEGSFRHVTFAIPAGNMKNQTAFKEAFSL
ncbi:Conserved hypothetical protein CHP02452 [Carpediemonas membranifera]|uniref:Microbial-type PARG catalytic domain-containing protein n=1 Tax=Carpediemonas membranifera TaxID=201153 RepID=A0A8J6E6K2_9EUKA|nr:Conserved hypothetical protein CHP02452 [Carpediemonas membranifera]|eukprot:KAG9389650.1 Conserved hypothetical protein CHP02452 [Carpediemonas membranifera]